MREYQFITVSIINILHIMFCFAKGVLNYMHINFYFVVVTYEFSLLLLTLGNKHNENTCIKTLRKGELVLCFVQPR